ncbi:hypothetical protein TanjilG_13664 [Lupinus angustifolius]|uniref:Protein EARLY FLOWERING 3 n=1 Tax=Lupinus angustifolius TaxID=3871 RepID=A0A1J7GW68_LUPAN|nr:PREDICTED: ELF3-like protein 2 isoform X2 [Lupinus angustifolius]OIW04816.1 hypothetical protein TanjilG_13664 [Lupinus angustifolius]
MKGIIDEGKEISPMFPRLHVKDAEKGGPKPPPRNKMALYEQFNIPSQSIASGSTSLYPLPLRKCTIPSTSSHVSSNQTIQFCTSSAASVVAENIQVYDSRKINLNKLMQHNFINSKKSLKIFDGEDISIASSSDFGKNSSCSMIQNDKLDNCNLIYPLKSPSSLRKKVSSPETIALEFAQYGKNLMEEHFKMSRKGWKPEEESANPIDGFCGMADSSFLSLNKDKNFKSSMKEHRFLKEETTSISKDCLKTLQGNNAEAREEHDEAFANIVDLQDNCMKKTADNDVYKCPDELEIGRRCLLSKRDRNKDEETCRDYDALNRPTSECKVGTDISPDSVLGVIGLKKFWKARKTIINQQRMFFMQVFELHRLIKVQKTIAASPHLLLEDNLVSNKQSLKPSAIKKIQSDYQQTTSIVKLNTKSEKPPTAEHAKNIAFRKIPPLPCLNNISKGLPYFVHDLRNPALCLPDINIKQSPSCVFPPPGNQWLVPVMSPSEGLVYKPMAGPCPPNPGFMPPPVHNAFSTMAFNLGSKDATDAAALSSGSHQRTGIPSGSSLPNSLPPPFMIPPMLPVSAVEHIWQSNGPEEANSAILYQSSSNLSSQASRALSRNVPTSHHSLKEKESQTSTATSPPKRVKGDVLPLFPVAPTLWPSTKDKNKNVENQPRIIKAMPHNPKSATESAARIFRSIQEERKFL